MNKNTILTGSLLVIAGMLATAASASASAIVYVDTNSVVNTTITTKASSTLKSNTSVNASTSLNTNLGSGSSTNYETSDSAMIKSGQISGRNGSVSLPSNINTTAQLQSYQNNLMTSESAIEEINTDEDNQVTVVWDQRGKLFAIFPITVSTETTVEVNEVNISKVSTDKPWWSVFVTDIADTSAETKAKLESSNEVKAYANAKTNAQAKAQVIYAIVSELKANTEADVDLNMKANLKSHIN